MACSSSDTASRTDHLSVTIGSRMQAGTCAPGERLPTRELLSERSASIRTVVREAVARLAAQGPTASRRGSAVFSATTVWLPACHDGRKRLGEPEDVIGLDEFHRASIIGSGGKRRVLGPTSCPRHRPAYSRTAHLYRVDGTDAFLLVLTQDNERGVRFDAVTDARRPPPHARDAAVGGDRRGAGRRTPMRPVPTGFTDGPGHVYGRPRPLAAAGDGALLVVDDKGGTIRRVAAAGKVMAGKGTGS